MVAIASRVKKVRQKNIPDYLVKDEIDGVRFYYRDYKLLLKNKANEKETMGCSAIQWLIIEYLLEVIYASDIRKKYRVATNEGGNHLAHGDNLSFDIALYDKEKLTGSMISKKYVQGVPPHTVIEVDTDVSLDNTNFDSIESYYFAKTKKLMDYGTAKVVWIFSTGKKILIAEGKVWQIYDFDNDILLIDDVYFNIASYLEREKINL